jgi:hypothetical protein
MPAKHSDLISIVNSELSDKLDRQEKKKAKLEAITSAPPPKARPRFSDDVWKAVSYLNYFRFALAIILLASLAVGMAYPNSGISLGQNSPGLFIACSLMLLVSAALFAFTIRKKQFSLEQQVLIQFGIDILLTAALVHASGGMDSNFILLYFVVVATGSVVLPQIQALGLASAAIIALFYQTFYTYFTSQYASLELSALSILSCALFAIAFVISYLAKRIRLAEMRRFIPGQENIEDFLIREERNALEAALRRTDGNKTEAAKLLGMSFRSFRYKVSKYEIE